MEGKYGRSNVVNRVGFYSNKIYHSNIEFFNIDTLSVLCQGEGLTYSNEVIAFYKKYYILQIEKIIINVTNK